MPLWIFRISAILGFPFLVYMFVSKDINNVLLALLCGIILVLAEHFIRSLKFFSIMIGFFGALVGFMVYVLFDYMVIRMNIPDLQFYWDKYQTIAAAILTVLGGFLSIAKASELQGLSKKGNHIKIADMSALIDGRIVDLYEIDFLGGVVVIPQFVVEKLNALASSKDPLEKAKGRRGLDIVTRLRELKTVPVSISSKTVEGSSTAELIVNLAKEFKGEIITIDFNVNKEAALHDVPVLNISDLTTALKPVVLPGEHMSLFIMKEGKEKEQGIGYLDDGTMVVVEDGRKYIGKRLEVSVYSILQTSTGRIIFAKSRKLQE
ncbi:MAG: PIN domain nuclease [Elusimicrobiota bacterium]|nr:PIN domain nuclease [Elusimicrobiota bacterium]